MFKLTSDMQPDQNAPQLSVDYLDQIAPKPQKGSSIFSNKPVLIVTMVLGLFVLITLIAVIAAAASGNISSTERLAARLVSTKDTVTKSSENIKSTQLRALNGSLSIYLTDTIRDITPLLAKNGVKIDKLSKKATFAESNTKLLELLEDARLNVRFDRVYAGEMSTQLENILILMRKINKSTNSASLKAFLDNAYKTLEPTQKEFSEFNDTTS